MTQFKVSSLLMTLDEYYEKCVKAKPHIRKRYSPYSKNETRAANDSSTYNDLDHPQEENKENAANNFTGSKHNQVNHNNNYCNQMIGGQQATVKPPLRPAPPPSQFPYQGNNVNNFNANPCAGQLSAEHHLRAVQCDYIERPTQHPGQKGLHKAYNMYNKPNGGQSQQARLNIENSCNLGHQSQQRLTNAYGSLENNNNAMSQNISNDGNGNQFKPRNLFPLPYMANMAPEHNGIPLKTTSELLTKPNDSVCLADLMNIDLRGHFNVSEVAKKALMVLKQYQGHQPGAS